MSSVHPLRVILKALLIFVVLNGAYAIVNPPVGRLTIYNWLVKGRERLPTAVGNRDLGHNLTPSNLDAALASHVVSNGSKPASEFRVILLGDSQTWGWSARSSTTLAEELNKLKLTACGGRQLRFYNLAHPGTSLLKDLLIMHKSLEDKPDLVIWMVTLRSFTVGPKNATWNQILATMDPMNARAVLDSYGLGHYGYLVGNKPGFYDRTIVGQRAELARLTLMQLYGPLWDATGVDNVPDLSPMPVDVSADKQYDGTLPPQLPFSKMEFDVLRAAHRMIGNTPVLVVNEPIYIAPGKNSDIRYNREYPRWAFDQFRAFVPQQVAQERWSYVDLYNTVPAADFAGAFHLTPNGEQMLAAALAPLVLKMTCP